MDIQDLQGNENLEEDGVWLEFEDAKFLVGAHGSRRHRKAIDKHRKKLQTALRRKEQKANDELTIQSAADALLLDWSGNVTSKGVPLPYSRENAVVLLNVRVFREWLLEQALDVSNFAKEAEAADLAALKSGTPVETGVGQ